MAKPYTLNELKLILPANSRLTILCFDETIVSGGKRKRMIKCRCHCGKVFTTRLEAITKGHTKSCKCLQAETVSIRNKKYENNILLINRLYLSIKTRCYDDRHPTYSRYGAKGVIMCDEWLNSYPSFLKWCLDNGWKKGLHIDKDMKGDGMGLLYSPETCHFVTPYENLTYPKRATRIKMMNMKNKTH